MTADCCTALVLTAAVYVTNIVEDEQPDWTPPEDPEADVETEDESHAAGMLHGIWHVLLTAGPPHKPAW